MNELRKAVGDDGSATPAGQPFANIANRVIGVIVVAALAVACGILVRLGLFNELMRRAPYVTLFPAVTAAAVIRGLPAGVTATGLAALAVAGWIAPLQDQADEIGMAAFLFSCSMILGVTEAMHRANARAAKAESRGRISDAIRENEARMRVLIDQASDGIFFGDASGRILDANREACTLLGYSRDEFLTRSLEDTLEPEEAGRFQAAIDGIHGQQAHYGEWRLRRKNGTTFLGEISARRLSTGGLQAFLRDVSERRRAEITLKESQAHLSAVVDTAVDAIVVIDSAGIIQSLNPATVRIFGFEAPELIGQNVSRLMDEPHRSRHDDYIQSYLSTGKAKVIGVGRTIEARKKDGTLFPIDLRINETRINGKCFEPLAKRLRVLGCI